MSTDCRASLQVLLGMVSAAQCVGLLGPAQAEMVHPADFALRPVDDARSRFTTHMARRPHNAAPAIRSLIETMKFARTTLLAEALTLPDLATKKRVRRAATGAGRSLIERGLKVINYLGHDELPVCRLTSAGFAAGESRPPG